MFRNKYAKSQFRYSSSESKTKQMKKQRLQEQKTQSFEAINVETNKRTLKQSFHQNLYIKNIQVKNILQKQKRKQLDQINSNPSLKCYYLTMISLFMMLYTSSQIVLTNLFQYRNQSRGLGGVGLLGIIIGIFNNIMDDFKIKKIKKLAKNVIKLEASPSGFQKRIEFISRKVTLNINKRKQIIFACMNQSVDQFWQKLIQLIPYNTQIQFLDSMFETAQAQLCYRDVSYLINLFLCNDKLFKRMQEDYKKHEGNECQLTFEFYLIEILCIQVDQQWILSQNTEKQEIFSFKNDCIIF